MSAVSRVWQWRPHLWFHEDLTTLWCTPCSCNVDSVVLVVVLDWVPFIHIAFGSAVYDIGNFILGPSLQLQLLYHATQQKLGWIEAWERGYIHQY